MASPTCLRQAVMVPSVTVSPSWGIAICSIHPNPTHAHARRVGRTVDDLPGPAGVHWSTRPTWAFGSKRLTIILILSQIGSVPGRVPRFPLAFGVLLALLAAGLAA